jgi:hypothetical protein
MRQPKLSTVERAALDNFRRSIRRYLADGVDFERACCHAGVEVPEGFRVACVLRRRGELIDIGDVESVEELCA